MLTVNDVLAQTNATWFMIVSGKTRYTYVDETARDVVAHCFGCCNVKRVVGFGGNFQNAQSIKIEI